MQKSAMLGDIRHFCIVGLSGAAVLSGAAFAIPNPYPPIGYMAGCTEIEPQSCCDTYAPLLEQKCNGVICPAWFYGDTPGNHLVVVSQGGYTSFEYDYSGPPFASYCVFQIAFCDPNCNHGEDYLVGGCPIWHDPSAPCP